MCQLRTVACLASLLLLASVASAQQDVINTFAGGGPNNLPATSANVPQAQAVATDAFGNYYIASNGSVNNPPESRVFKVNSSGTLTLFAGNGFQGYSGDGGPALQAELNYPSGVAADSFGNVYIADTNNCVIRKVDSSGTITTFAGTPNVCNFGGDGGFATSAYLSYPNGVAVDSYGNVYIADTNNFRIREVTISNGEINTVAGGYNCTSGGAACGDGGPAIGAGVSYVYSLALDGSNNIYITDYYNYSIREFSVGGNINTVAGNGTWCGSGGAACGDGGAATSAELSHVLAVAVDSPGNIFIADRDNYSVREVTVSNHIINTVAGGYNCYLGGLACGDGGAATSAGLSQVYGLAVDTSDDIFIADYSNYGIREVTNTNGTTKPVSGNINTVAGDGTFSFAGNGVPPLNASLYQPSGVTSDSSGNIYIADQTNEVVREVNATTGNITTIAGTPGVFGYFGDGGEATAAELYYPNKVAVYEGNVYIADTFNCVIRLVDTSGTIATFAGVPQECGPGTDGGPATSSKLYYPYGVAVDSSGNVYIADQGDQSIRMVSGGIITTVAGMGYGHQGYSGDGGPATSAELYYPVDVAVDSAGNLYIADSNNAVVRMVNTAGIISTIAGGGTGCLGETDSVGDGCPATAASLSNLQGVAVDAAGDVLIADTYNNRIRWVDGLGIIHSVAGDGTYDFSGDGGPATSATLADPWGVGLDPSGNIYIADYRNFQVRLVNAVAALNASTTSLTFGPQAVGTPSSPQTVTLAAVGPLDISNIVFTGDFSSPDDCVTGPMSGQCVMSIVFTPTGTGTRQGTVTISDNGYFSSSLVINLQGTGTALSTPTITFGTAPSPTYGGGNFVVNASTSSNGTLTFGAYSGPCGLVSSTATTATFSSSAAGTCVVQASVAATSTYSAGSAQQAVTISQASQTITFTTLAPPTEVYMGTFPVAATASSGLTVTLTVDASSTSVCSLAGSTVTMNSGTGTCTIDANQSGNTNYGTAPQVQTSATATKATPTVTWSTPPPASAVYNSQFTVVATTNSTGAITYSTSGGCSNNAGVVTMTSGTTACQVSASAAADANYTTGSVGPTSVAATLASQTITFNNPGAQTVGTPLQLTASASSGLAVSFNSQTTSVCTVSGTTATFIAAGTCTIQASQGGNANYQAATPVSQSFQVSAAPVAGFTITPIPASETVTRGDIAAFVLELNSVNGFKGNVNLACSSLPTGSYCVDFPQTVYLTKQALAVSGVMFPKTTPPGTYTITFTGTSGSIVVKATAKFTVE